MRQRLLILILLSALVLQSRGQKADSLLNVLDDAESDTVRVNTLLELGYVLRKSAPDSAIGYINKANEISKQLLQADAFAIRKYAQRVYPSGLSRLGYIIESKGNYEEALTYYRKSAALYREHELDKEAIKRDIFAGKIHRTKGDNDKALEVLRNALSEAKEAGYKPVIGMAYQNIGYLFRNKGEYTEAKNYFSKNLELQKSINDKEGIADAYNSLGIICYMQSNYSKAVDYFIKTLKLREEVSSKSDIAGSYNNIGAILMMQEQYEKALEYYKKYLNISRELEDKRNIGKAYSNIGVIHQNLNNDKKAIEYYKQSVDILEDAADKRSLSTTLLNLGDLYIKARRYELARQHLNKCLNITREIGDNSTLAAVLVNLATLKEKTGAYEQSIDYALNSLKITTEQGALDEQQHTYKTLADAYSALGEYEKAYEAHKNYKELTDSIFNKEKHKQITELETKYQTEKKEQQNKLLKKQNELKDAEIKRQRVFSFAIAIVALLLTALIFVILRSRQKQKHANNILVDKNEEINQQKEELKVQNDYIKNQHKTVSRQKQQITDSINYASRIQRAMLPLQENLEKHLNGNYFVYYKPRDIVSGDFYWFHAAGDRKFFVVADCTGHGVPGAFMSLIGIDLLNQIVTANPGIRADELLRKLHEGVILALRQDASESRDGMDIGVLVFENDKQPVVEFAGAKLPLIYVDDELHVVKGNRMPVGRWHYERFHTYERQQIRLTQPTVFYMFSDGYQDQPGGREQRKFMVPNFRNMLQQISNLSMDEQKKELDNTLKSWMQTSSGQIDDVLVCGIRLKP